MIDFMVEALKDSKREEKYKKFQLRLSPTKYYMEGIRIKPLRAIAKELVYKVSINDLIGLEPTTFEELTLLGLIIAYYPCRIEEKFEPLDYFISLNDNWSTNDAVYCAVKDKSEAFFQYLMERLLGSEWEARFAITSLMDNFLDKEHLHTIFDGLYKIEYGRKYVDTAVAWLLSMAYMDFRDEVEDFYENAPLNAFILKLVVFKIRDIIDMPQEYKERIEEIYKDVLCKKGL